MRPVVFMPPTTFRCTPGLRPEHKIFQARYAMLPAALSGPLEEGRPFNVQIVTSLWVLNYLDHSLIFFRICTFKMAGNWANEIDSGADFEDAVLSFLTLVSERCPLLPHSVILSGECESHARTFAAHYASCHPEVQPKSTYELVAALCILVAAVVKPSRDSFLSAFLCVSNREAAAVAYARLWDKNWSSFPLPKPPEQTLANGNEVLNSHYRLGLACDLEAISQELVGALLRIILDYGSEFELLRSCPELTRFSQRTAQLRFAVTEGLSEEQKVAGFINLYNCLNMVSCCSTSTSFPVLT